MSRFAIFGLASLVFLSACKRSETTETEPTLPYPTEEGFCSALAEAECNKKVVDTCYGSDDTTFATDKTSCEDARKAGCNPDGLPYHPEQSEPCIIARKQALLDAVWTRAELDGVFTTCLPVFSKEGTKGKTCANDHDCDVASDLRCVVKLGSIEGVCEKPVTVGGGEDCSSNGTVCAQEFYCDSGAHCVVRSKLAGACSAGVPCTVDFYCSNPEDGTCQEKSKNGKECDRDELCSGGFCIGADVATTGICSATLPLSITSYTCDLYRQ